MFFAGLGNFVFAFANRDFARVTWTARGIGAVAYLVVGGSLIGYTAYIYILGHAPTAKVSTYAYVNPVVAVLVGYFLGGEELGPRTILGTLFVLISVVVITTAPAKPIPIATEQKAAEATRS